MNEDIVNSLIKEKEKFILMNENNTKKEDNIKDKKSIKKQTKKELNQQSVDIWL